MAWIKVRENYAEGPGDWRYQYMHGGISMQDLKSFQEDLDGSHSWNHGYRGSDVEPLTDHDVPLEILLEEAKTTLAQHGLLQEKLRVLQEAIMSSATKLPEVN